MSAKKLEKYLPEKPFKKAVPARIRVETIERAQHVSRTLNIPLTDLIDGAINLFCDQAMSNQKK
jgi:hypothetical protein